MDEEKLPSEPVRLEVEVLIDAIDESDEKDVSSDDSSDESAPPQSRKMETQ